MDSESFSPNGQELIIVRSNGQAELRRINLALGTEVRVTSNVANDYDPVWSLVDNCIIVQPINY